MNDKIEKYLEIITALPTASVSLLVSKKQNNLNNI